MTVNQELLEIRKSIDNLDNALVAVLAERFRLTERVGFLKRDLNLPPEDRERESAQEKHYSELASSYGLDRATLIEIMRTIISQVKRRHVEIRSGAVRGDTGDSPAQATTG